MNLARSLRRAVAVTLASVVTLGLTGCTTGGDDGESLEIDDGGEATATVAAAIDAARSGTGRFHTEYTVTDEYTDEPERFSADGEFSGDDLRFTAAMDEAAAVDSGAPTSTTTLRVGGSTYQSLDMLRSLLAAFEGFELPAAPDGDTTQTDTYTPSVPGLDTLQLDGREWIDVGALDEANGLDDLLRLTLAENFQTDPFRLLEGVEQVEEHEAVAIDDRPTRHFTATVPPSEMLSLVLGEAATEMIDRSTAAPEGDVDEYAAEEQRRVEIAERYVDERTSVQVDLYLDDQDGLRRVEVSAAVDIEPQYEDCSLISLVFETIELTTDFRDLGDEVVISPPDPTTVLPLAELVAAFPADPEDAVERDDDTDFGATEPVVLETVHGPRDRYDVEDDLAKFGYVIGLGEDPNAVPAEEGWSVGPEVWDLSDEELVARYAEVDAALAQLPRTSTAIGELTRPELLWNVQWGLEQVGGDSSVAVGMSDAELGALIDGYVEGQGGPVGDGVWGPLPEGVAPVEEPWSEQQALDELVEGCPE